MLQLVSLGTLDCVLLVREHSISIKPTSQQTFKHKLSVENYFVPKILGQEPSIIKN